MVENNAAFPSSGGPGNAGEHPIAATPTAVAPSPQTTPSAAPASAPAQTPIAPASATPAPASASIPAAPASVVPAQAPAASATPYFGRRFQSPRADFSSPATGDITLAHPTKKSKKPLIIAAALGLLVATIAVIAVIISKPSDTAVISSPREAANQYLSYLMYGSTEDDFSGEEFNIAGSLAYDIYYGIPDGPSREEQLAFFGEASALLDNLLSSLGIDDLQQVSSPASLAEITTDLSDEDLEEDNVEPSTQEIRAILRDNKSQLDTVIAFIETGYVSRATIIKRYTGSSSADAIRNAISQNYNSMNNIDNYLAQKYSKIQLSIVDNTLEMINIFEQAGCPISQELQTDCLPAAQREKLEELLSTEDDLQKSATDTAGQFILVFLGTAQRAYGMISNRTIKQ